jgi:hypothetical protein
VCATAITRRRHTICLLSDHSNGGDREWSLGRGGCGSRPCLGNYGLKHRRTDEEFEPDCRGSEEEVISFSDGEEEDDEVVDWALVGKIL